MKNIYLVGFMGTGKSVVGKALAKKQKRQFIDLDELIELKEKRQIRDIFAKEGEAYFRRVEHETLKEVSAQINFMVACGGGIVINPANIRIMKETGTIVCLSASPKKILERTKGYMHRPLLNVENPQKQIELLLKLRAPYYGQADFTIDTSDLSAEEVRDKIITLTSKARRKK